MSCVITTRRVLALSRAFASSTAGARSTFFATMHRIFLLHSRAPHCLGHRMPHAAVRSPNIVVILADDLGYGDVALLQPRARQDPHAAHRPARRARDALHRRALVLGRLLADAVLAAHRPLPLADAAAVGHRRRVGQPLIAPGPAHASRGLREAARLPHRLRRQMAPRLGLAHRGGADEALPGPRRPGGGGGKVDRGRRTSRSRRGRTSSPKPIAGGPTTRGFDEYFGTDVPNWPPYCFIENDRTVGIPTELLPRQLMKNQASLQGPALTDWNWSHPAGARRPRVRLHREAGEGEAAVPALPAADCPAHAHRPCEVAGQERLASTPTS